MTIPGIKTKPWTVYFVTILFSSFFHELGHCIVAWVHGCSAIPTLAKEYLLHPAPAEVNEAISAGGIVFSALFAVTGIVVYWKSDWSYRAAMLAGALAMPAIYTLRFILMGRGHDGSEFQEAQAALGWSYSGHAADWLFTFLGVAGAIAWMIASRPGWRTWINLLIGAIATVVFIVLLQTLNNRIFDPIFSNWKG